MYIKSVCKVKYGGVFCIFKRLIRSECNMYFN